MNLPISSMTIAERSAAMAELWASSQRDADEIAPPDWHGRVQAERQKRIANGQTSFSSLEEVRARLENREE